MKTSKINLTKSVIALFSNPQDQFSYEELVHQLSLVRKEKAILSEVLQDLLDTRKLTKSRGLYKSAGEARKAAPEINARSNSQIEGVFDATPLAKNQTYAFVRTAQGDYLVTETNTLNAYHGDRVLIEVKKGVGRNYSAFVRRIVERANTTIVGTVHSLRNKLFVISSNPKIHRWFECIGDCEAGDGIKVVMEVSNWGNPELGKLPQGKMVEVLGQSGDPQVELLSVIRQYDLSLTFPPEVIAASEELSEAIETTETRGRVDLRDILTFTIDPQTAKDFDDAISLEISDNGWKLYVHIADVAHYVNQGGAIYNEACKRGNSFYLPKLVIPMLPERLSNQICSLRPDEDKLTMTVITEFDKKGRVLKQKLVESIIRSDFRLSYEEVDELFLNRKISITPELAQVLGEARILSSILSKKRIQAGYIFFDLPELEIAYDDEGFIKHFTLSEETESHKLIENFMLVANEYVANKLRAVSPIVMYRVHDEPDTAKLHKLSLLLKYYGVSWQTMPTLNETVQHILKTLPDEKYHQVFDRVVLRSMKKAKYSNQHGVHFGLGMETYTHFTSPIRRLCDLLVHHLCKTYLLRKPGFSVTSQQIAHLAFIACEQEIKADQAERDIERVYSQVFMKDRIGETFSGMVISAKADGLIVRLDEIPVNTLLRKTNLPKGRWTYQDEAMRFISGSGKDYLQLMDSVKVRIIEVSDDMYVELTDDNITKHHTSHFRQERQTAKPLKQKPQVKRRRR